MRALAYTVVVMSALAASAGCVKHVSKIPNIVSFGLYDPVPISSEEMLPEEIATAARSHLQQRLGSKFASTLWFAGGQRIDFDDLYRASPHMKNAKWTIPRYRLFYSYRNLAAGIQEFRAEIRLDEDAKIISEVDLPQVADFPEKGQFVPLEEAKRVAWSKGYASDEVELKYSEDFDAIVWQFERRDGRSTWHLQVSAHTAEPLREWGTSGID